MGYPVRYYCPHCGTILEIERSGYLADRCVTPYPLEGWSYVSVHDSYEDDDVDGIRFVCGETTKKGCGEAFYLSYVRFEDGERVEPHPESEFVEINPGPNRPRWPDGP